MNTLFRSEDLKNHKNWKCKNLECSLCKKYITIDEIDSVFYIDMTYYKCEDDKLSCLICDKCCEQLISNPYTYEFVYCELNPDGYSCESKCDICNNELDSTYTEYGTTFHGYVSNFHRYSICEDCHLQIKNDK